MSLLRIFLCCIIVCGVSSHKRNAGKSNFKLPEDIAKNISNAIVQIIDKSFVEEKHKVSFNLYAKAIHANRMGFFGEVMDITIRTLGDTIATQVGVGIMLPESNQRHYGVIMVDSAKSLNYLYTQFAKYHLGIKGYYIILLHTFHNSFYAELQAISALTWQVDVINVNVLVYVTVDLIMLYTIFPFDDIERCDNFIPTLNNRFVGSHWQHEDFYPNKVSNMNGCPVECGTWPDMPYLAVKRDYTTGMDELIGIEGKLLEFLAWKMNFTLEIRWMNDDEINRTIYDQNVLFDELFINGTDAVVGAFHYRPSELEDPVAPTSFYYLSNLILVVSSKTQPYGPFRKLLFPFRRILWAVVLAIIICGVIVSLAANYLKRSTRSLLLGQRNETPIYNMFVVGLGGTAEPAPTRNFARFLLMMWLIVTIVLRSVYQAYLFHFIRADIGVPPPNFMADILAQRYRVHLSRAFYEALLPVRSPQARHFVLNASEVESFPMLLHTNEKLGVIATAETFGYYKRTHTDAAYYHVVREKVYTQALSIYMPKSSVLLSQFNKQIQNYLNIGLMTRWLQVYVHADGRKPTRRVEEQPPQVMKLEHLRGAFLLLCYGTCLSLIVFIVEVGIQRVKQQKQIKQKY